MHENRHTKKHKCAKQVVQHYTHTYKHRESAPVGGLEYLEEESHSPVSVRTVGEKRLNGTEHIHTAEKVEDERDEISHIYIHIYKP